MLDYLHNKRDCLLGNLANGPNGPMDRCHVGMFCLLQMADFHSLPDEQLCVKWDLSLLGLAR